MKRSRLFMMAAVLMLTVKLSAQFAINAGVGLSTFKLKQDFGGDIEKWQFDGRPGINMGIAYRMPLGTTFSMQPEVNFISRSGVYEDNSDGDQFKSELRAGFLELPIYFLYTGENASGFFGGLGPALNFGLSGRSKWGEPGFENEEDIVWGNEGEDGELKRMHIAINGLVGYQLQSGINFNAYISRSITNSLGNSEQFNSTFNTFSFGLRVGYLFGSAGSRAMEIKNPL